MPLIPRRRRGALFAAVFVTAAAGPSRAEPTPPPVVRSGADLQRTLDGLARGSTLHLAPDTVYELTAPLRPGAGVTVRGAGAGSSTLRFATGFGDDQPLVELRPGRDDITLTGFTLDGQNRTDGARHGVVASFGRGHRVDRLEIRDLARPDPEQFGPVGVYFADDVDDAAVTRSVFTNIGATSLFGSGVRIEKDSDRNRVEGNTFDGLGRGGVFANGTAGGPGPDHLVIRDNTVTRSGLAYLNPALRDPDAVNPRLRELAGLGIELQNGVSDAVVENNTLDQWLSVDNVRRVALRDNVVRGVVDPRIAAIRGELAAANVRTPAFGIEVVNAEDVVVEGNTVRGGNVGFSVSGEGDTRRLLVAGNTFDLTPPAGADADGGGGPSAPREFAAQLQGDDGDTPGPGNEGIAERIYLLDNVFTGSTNDALRLNRNVHDVVVHGGTLASDAAGLGLTGLGNTDELSFAGIVLTDDVALPRGGVDNANFPDALRTETRSAVRFAVSAGDPLGLDLTDPAFAGLDTPERVLWDTGAGAPAITDILPDDVVATLGPAGPDAPAAGALVRAVVWDADGDAVLVEFAVVPEPAAAALLGVGVAGTLLSRRRRRH